MIPDRSDRVIDDWCTVAVDHVVQTVEKKLEGVQVVFSEPIADDDLDAAFLLTGPETPLTVQPLAT